MRDICRYEPVVWVCLDVSHKYYVCCRRVSLQLQRKVVTYKVGLHNDVTHFYRQISFS